MSFKKASRSAKYLRILIEGPSGSGKTYGALLMGVWNAEAATRR